MRLGEAHTQAGAAVPERAVWRMGGKARTTLYAIRRHTRDKDGRQSAPRQAADPWARAPPHRYGNANARALRLSAALPHVLPRSAEGHAAAVRARAPRRGIAGVSGADVQARAGVNLDENRATIRMRSLPPIDLSRRTARVVNVSLRQCADHSVAATALRIVPGHLEPVDQFAGAQTATEAAAILAALLFDRERRLRCAEHRRVRDSSPEVTSAWLARSPALASRVSCVIRRANGREPAGALSKCERASWARWSLDSQSCAGGPIRGQTYGTGRSSARLAQPPAAEDA